MDIEQIFPADTFVVINNTILSQKDQEVLYKLYQPIIGISAIGLYNTLSSYLDVQQIMSLENTHHLLIHNTKLKIDQIKEARKSLEAVGLLKTYVKKDVINNYIYELYSPLDPIEFLKNPILNSALINHVDSREYKRVVDYFKLPKFNLSEYDNITSKFSDVFTVSNQIYKETIEAGKKNTTLMVNIDDNVDVISVINLIPDEMLNKKTITKETVELIKRLAFLYAFTDDCLEEIIRSSINEKRAIDKKVLSTNCINFYKFENKGNLPKIIFKNQPESKRKQNKTNTMKDKLIHTYEVTSPFVFLRSKYNGAKPSQNDLEILVYLAEEMKLNSGVINVLIDYVLRINDNKLIKKFVEMVASQWKMSNIETVEEAMEISKREMANRKKIATKNKKIEEKPTWFNGNIKENTDPIKQQELEQLLSKYE